jgi:hypothetical protein
MTLELQAEGRLVVTSVTNTEICVFVNLTKFPDNPSFSGASLSVSMGGLLHFQGIRA